MIPCILHPRGEAKRVAGSTGAAKGLWKRLGPPTENPTSRDEKGPDARRRPMAAREAYFLYVARAVEGANEADGPLSSL
jgi:hypothetical protein